jgi:hypothetical protein
MDNKTGKYDLPDLQVRYQVFPRKHILKANHQLAAHPSTGSSMTCSSLALLRQSHVWSSSILSTI